ncbi:MAG: winged helix-turn-helix transcriptional regulator [Alphaproteobacteria bacterium]|nr:winged helix-turn-helix transcriptional regulator [Alphaproteobacteria bacterium]
MNIEMDMSVMEAASERAVALMASLSHPGRLRILCHLAEGELSVGALAKRLGMRQAAMSQQLGLLRREGLVASRRAGQVIHYRLASPEAEAVVRLLYELYCPAAREAL